MTRKVYCSTCGANFIALLDDAHLSADFRFTCRQCCSPDGSMLEGMTNAAILESTLARRVAGERRLLPKRMDRTAERIQKWRTANQPWTRIYKMLRRAGVQITKATAAAFMEKWTVRIGTIGSACSFCGRKCEPDTVQFWRDPAGDPLEPEAYWPACARCAARKRAEVRWKKAA
jgi:hypothetical protein